MNQTFSLRLASLILFWFGIIAEIIVIFSVVGQLYFDGHTRMLTPYESDQVLLNATNFTYTLFGHFVHIVAAYWLVKGTKKGFILGLSISIFEIVTFFVPNIDPELFTFSGLGIRILFAFIIFLIIFGRESLPTLRKENWRPWNKPWSIQH